MPLVKLYIRNARVVGFRVSCNVNRTDYVDLDAWFLWLVLLALLGSPNAKNYMRISSIWYSQAVQGQQ